MTLRIHAGCAIQFDCPNPTPMLLQVAVHPSRIDDLLAPELITFEPDIPAVTYRDIFDNCCTRIVAPAGLLTISTAFDIMDSGLPDAVDPDAHEHRVEDLPDEMLIFLLGSRYCETAHLAIAFCRCMNIPARYCTGYLGDMGMPPPYSAGDFSAWFEAYLGGQWHTFDARHNIPRIGRILMARGRDATDCAISTSFGAATLTGFTVVTDEVPEDSP
jgi:hypothetical protein